jgi:hypothetical protein
MSSYKQRKTNEVEVRSKCRTVYNAQRHESEVYMDRITRQNAQIGNLFPHIENVNVQPTGFLVCLWIARIASDFILMPPLPTQISVTFLVKKFNCVVVEAGRKVGSQGRVSGTR